MKSLLDIANDINNIVYDHTVPLKLRAEIATLCEDLKHYVHPLPIERVYVARDSLTVVTYHSDIEAAKKANDPNIDDEIEQVSAIQINDDWFLLTKIDIDGLAEKQQQEKLNVILNRLSTNDIELLRKHFGGKIKS